MGSASNYRRVRAEFGGSRGDQDEEIRRKSILEKIGRINRSNPVHEAATKIFEFNDTATLKIQLQQRELERGF